MPRTRLFVNFVERPDMDPLSSSASANTLSATGFSVRRIKMSCLLWSSSFFSRRAYACVSVTVSGGLPSAKKPTIVKLPSTLLTDSASLLGVGCAVAVVVCGGCGVLAQPTLINTKTSALSMEMYFIEFSSHLS